MVATGVPSANQDQASPQLSDTRAETKPVVDSTPKARGHPQSFPKEGEEGVFMKRSMNFK